MGSPLCKRLGPAIERVDLKPGLHPGNLGRIRRAARTGAFDLIACHTSAAHSLAVVSGLSVVVHRRVDFVVGSNPWSRWKYRSAHRFVAVSQGVVRVLCAAGVAEADIDVVHDGVPTATAQSPASDLSVFSPLVGAVGALVDHKAHHLLVSAMAKLPGVQCVIVGEGPLRQVLADQIARLSLADRVFLLGYRTDMGAIFAALDLLVHPSIEEGMGQVVVEAMYAGCPVLVSRAGGLPEVVGSTSEPFAVGDVDALAAAIAKRLKKPGSVEAARSRAEEHFSIDKMVEGTVRAYGRAISSD
jgi:glycosyltransferase involved in cell wall biosynthesis